MVIVYGTRTLFKREGIVDTFVCPNCQHNVMHTLCRQLNQATLFYIPIFSHQQQRGIMCESCGMITPLNAKEYKERKKDAKMLQKN
ncbi:MAG: zinc-ribbon domain-containing protein [Clostridiales bacterium]|uniref:zinc-ribbon domain-containing protein n=1 Tax=Roseburia sp. MSJ-14 TaxID=2841514 RepID=UPI00169DB92B|nr:zinc-ribbon domain-containing protein [Roseburia sp. MSJ-14]MBU5473532.1 zinc-ribbon domain-containing protein [Roseburia sp. MSJ-14]NLK78204.1 zinc-ribbon domain-containing protein [Clostridiales bacterium]